MCVRITKVLLIIITIIALSGCEDKKTLNIKDTVILFTNDLHCTDDNGLTYAKIAQYKDDMETLYGDDNVTLVDTGDAFWGNMLGYLSKGSYIVDIMNEVGYDIAVPGENEFTYGVDNFMKSAEDLSNFPYIAANFTDINGDDLLDSYRIIEYGDRKIAYLGIITPHALTANDPDNFKDADGNYLYTFYGEDDSTVFYERIQAKIDEIREDVDYIVALAHLGMDDEDEYSSDSLLANTDGIDILIDGHTHDSYNTTLKDKDGHDVIVMQAGTKGEYIGKIMIDSDGNIDTELILTDTVIADDRYREVEEYLTGINDKVDQEIMTVIGNSEYDLIANSYDQIAGLQETNLGDLIADAYRYALDSDVAIVSSSQIRDDICDVYITYRDILNVLPSYDRLCLIETTGQTIIDALEFGAKDLPDNSDIFLQVSGIRYTIDTSFDSNVITDQDGNFNGVNGEYRITDVYVYDKESDAYLPLDPEKTYQLAADSFTIKDGGNGMTMFMDQKIVYDAAMNTSEALITYIKDTLNGEIPDTYGSIEGSDRIEIIDGRSLFHTLISAY